LAGANERAELLAPLKLTSGGFTKATPCFILKIAGKAFVGVIGMQARSATNIFIVAPSSEALQRIQKTVARAIDVNELERFLPADLSEIILAHSHGGPRAFGLQEGHDSNTWKKMQPGDIVLFYGAKYQHFNFVYSAQIVAKTQNAELADALWTLNNSPGKTFPLIYFLTNVMSVSVPLDVVGAYLGFSKRIQQTRRVADEKIERIRRDMGSVEEFLRRYFSVEG
jgi:hypothetical protein